MADGEHVALALSDGCYLPGRRARRGDEKSGRIELWHVDADGQIVPLNSPLATTEMPWVADLAFLTGERPLLVAANRFPRLPYHVWNWRTGAHVAPLNVPRKQGQQPAFSPDGSWLATPTDRQVIVWDTVTWVPAATLSIKNASPKDLAFSPDGALLLTLTGTGRIHLWDVTAGKIRETFCWRNTIPKAVAFAPDGLTAAAAYDYDDAIVLWDID